MKETFAPSVFFVTNWWCAHNILNEQIPVYKYLVLNVGVFRMYFVRFDRHFGTKDFQKQKPFNRNVHTGDRFYGTLAYAKNMQCLWSAQ